MQFLRNNNTVKFLFLFSIFTLVSCSKDSDPDPSEITVSTSDFSITMDENPENGQSIGFVQGSTNEGSVNFSIMDQTPAGAFSIDAASGELTVVNESLFKFETHPIITGTIKVANANVYENAAVTINLNEVNEENVYDGDVWLMDQEGLDFFGSLGYTSISGFLRIGNYIQYSNINNLESLSSLKDIGGDLKIEGVHLLPTLEGLNNIKSIGRDLIIFSNNILINIEALNKLTEIPGDFWIAGNYQLVDYTGLQNITTVGGDLRFFSLSYVNSIGLSGITTVGGDLELWDFVGIESIDMNNITYIGGDLKIILIYGLTNLDFASNISEIAGNLKISSNGDLKDFCGLELLLSTNKLGGTYTVEDNEYNPTKQDIINGNCAI